MDEDGALLCKVYLMYEWPHAPYSFEEGRRCSYDPFTRVLRLLFGRDQKTGRSAGRRCGPSAERLCQVGCSRARIARSHDS
jgi:hypothetical protein